MPNDGTTTRNSVIQKVQNRNNIADMYLRRQMDDFKRHLAFKVLAIEMERLEWHGFLKDLRKCDSDDLTEFVPLLMDEFGEEGYTQRCRKLKTRFRDLFTAVELGLKDEKLSMDYVKIREAGEQAQKDHRKVKSELNRRPKPPPVTAEPERNPSPMKAVSRNDLSRPTGFITSMVSPGIDQVAQANRAQALGVNKLRDSHEDRQQLLTPHYGAPRPFFPSLPVAKKEEQKEQKKPKVKDGSDDDDDLESELDLGDDDDDDDAQKKKKKKDMMRNMVDKNAKKLKRRRRKPKKPLESRIEDFYTKIDSLKCSPQNSPKNLYLPPIGVSAY